MKRCRHCAGENKSPRTEFCSNSCRCKNYYQKTRKKQIERKTKYYYKMKQENYERLREINGSATLKYKNKKRFSGNRLEVLERDGHKCVECGKEDNLHVHHKDHSGYGGNNEMSNLETLCGSCHSKHHHKVRRQNKV